MIVQPLEHVGVEHESSGQLSLKGDVKKTQDQNEDTFLFFIDQLVNESGQDVFINHGLNTVGELGQVDQTAVSVISDLRDFVIKQVSDHLDKIVLNKGDSSNFSGSNQQNGMTCQLSDSVVSVSEALDHFGEDTRVESEVDFVSLVEVFVDFNEHFLLEHVIGGFHLLTHFVVFEVSIGEGEGALGKGLRVGLVAVVRYELTV